MLAAILAEHPVNQYFCPPPKTKKGRLGEKSIQRIWPPKCFGEGARGHCGHRSRRLVALAHHGVARAQNSFAQAQVTLGRLLVAGPKLKTSCIPARQPSSICADLTSVQGALVCLKVMLNKLFVPNLRGSWESWLGRPVCMKSRLLSPPSSQRRLKVKVSQGTTRKDFLFLNLDSGISGQISSGASRVSLHGGASPKANKAHCARLRKGPENHKHEVRLRPPPRCPPP